MGTISTPITIPLKFPYSLTLSVEAMSLSKRIGLSIDFFLRLFQRKDSQKISKFLKVSSRKKREKMYVVLLYQVHLYLLIVTSIIYSKKIYNCQPYLQVFTDFLHFCQISDMCLMRLIFSCLRWLRILKEKQSWS